MMDHEPAKLSPAQETIRRIFLDEERVFRETFAAASKTANFGQGCGACIAEGVPAAMTILHAWREWMTDAQARYPSHSFEAAQAGMALMLMRAALRSAAALAPRQRRADMIIDLANAMSGGLIVAVNGAIDREAKS